MGDAMEILEDLSATQETRCRARSLPLASVLDTEIVKEHAHRCEP